jgi:hypothetical protein
MERAEGGLKALTVKSLLMADPGVRPRQRPDRLPRRRREEVERRVELRLARQRILARPDPPRLWLVLDENTLRWEQGIMEDMPMPTTPYCGCGRCLVGTTKRQPLTRLPRP